MTTPGNTNSQAALAAGHPAGLDVPRKSSGILYVAGETRNPRIWSVLFQESVSKLGDLRIIEDGRSLSESEYLDLIGEHEILLTGWDSPRLPAALAENPGHLRYICHITGSVRHCIPLEIIESGIPVTNWGIAPAQRVAEGTLTLLLATLKDLHHHIHNIERGHWGMDVQSRGGSLFGMEIGIYGLGVIGRAFFDLIRPFGCTVKVLDPYVEDLPEDCIRVHSLEELFVHSKAIVVLAGLTPETHGSITADLLSLLPRHGVIVNTARGDIIDQNALFKELENGRLRAGLDVLAVRKTEDGLGMTEELPAGHPARQWENLILSSHKIEFGWPTFGEEPGFLFDYQQVCLDNLGRFIRGEDLQYQIDRKRYMHST